MIYRNASTGKLYRGWVMNSPSEFSSCLAEFEPHKLIWMELLSTSQEAQRRLEEKAETELGLEFISAANSLDSIPTWEKRSRLGEVNLGEIHC